MSALGPDGGHADEARPRDPQTAETLEPQPGVSDDPLAEDAAGDAGHPAELSEAQLEALLFVAERPLSRREIASIAGVDRDSVDARLGDLETSLAGRGIRLVLDGERVSLATSPEAGALVARYVGADAIRLSPAALETLAIVAYRQPVTKAAIEQLRGVDSDYTIRGLLHRRLIVELGRAGSPGRPFLYGTGLEFLERFGLTSLQEMPPLDAEVDARLVEAVDAAMASDATMAVDAAMAVDGTMVADDAIGGDEETGLAAARVTGAPGSRLAPDQDDGPDVRPAGS